jgi:two-component system response regulator YesN
MLKLLIVDDMPVITDGLYELFREDGGMPLEVHRAYSAPEALRLLEEIRMDIVVSDIKMPEVSGLELLDEINRRWPQCKVIFLTSYHDFEYAREAVVLGGFDFILKTEGDDRIIQAVHKAADEVLKNQESDQLRLRAQAQYKLALPSLQKQFLQELLHGRHIDESMRHEQFRALEMALHPAWPAFLVIVRIDRWKQSPTWSDKALLLYAVNNIVDEYLSSKVRMVTLQLDPSHLLSIWQPEGDVYNAKEYSKALRFFYGALETIQNTCRELLQLQLSFVLSSTPCAWEDAGEKLQSLELLLQSGIGLNRELLTTDEELHNDLVRRNTPGIEVQPIAILRMMQYSSLSGLLASGKQDEFFELYDDLSSTIEQAGEVPSLKLECIHYLASLFLGYMNRRRIYVSVKEKWGTSKLLNIAENPDWSSYSNYFRKLAVFLFEHTSNEQENRSNRLIQDIQQYIQEHLDQDLSLTKLGEQAHLNPTYLSRLYKQITGKGISDDITEARIHKAKSLLENSDRKIHEIAEDVGYQSGIAFTRFFKKMMNITPQEYRDTQNH